jgi:hypothetical protein
MRAELGSVLADVPVTISVFRRWRLLPLSWATVPVVGREGIRAPRPAGKERVTGRPFVGVGARQRLHNAGAPASGWTARVMARAVGAARCGHSGRGSSRQLFAAGSSGSTSVTAWTHHDEVGAGARVITLGLPWVTAIRWWVRPGCADIDATADAPAISRRWRRSRQPYPHHPARVTRVFGHLPSEKPPTNRTVDPTRTHNAPYGTEPRPGQPGTAPDATRDSVTPASRPASRRAQAGLTCAEFIVSHLATTIESAW